MKLSVIIPSYKRHNLTVRHVEECFKSKILPDEIIVINDGGDDSIQDALIKLNKTTRLVYAKIEEDILWNYVGAVNLGCWLSRGDVLAIEDCDHIPARHTYQVGLKVLEDNPDIDRIAFGRQIIQIKEMNKPMEEWISSGNMGSNQMVAFLRRDVYLRLKGQDERMAGHYGWMSYDFPYRRDKVLGAKTSKQNYYWAVLGDEGEPEMKRGLSRENRIVYKENARSGKLHSVHGILNFHFTYAIL